MRILLMYPLNDPNFGYDYMDLGLGYLASCLRKDGHFVQLALRPQEFGDPAIFLDFIRKNNFDLFGIKVMSMSVVPAKETIKMIRNTNKNAIVVVGGPHISCDGDNVFSLIPEADYAFYAEAEIGFPGFVKKISNGGIAESEIKTIPNLIWRSKNETIINAPKFVQNLDDLPFPAWDLMNPAKFSNTSYNGYSRRYPIAPLIQSRGCPFKCTFCGASLLNGFNIRTRSADNVMEEIRLLTEKFKVKELQLFDSNCAHPSAPLREVCRRIISEKIDITWNAPVGLRLDFVDKELVDLIKRSGCFQVSVGIESASPRILKMIRKQLTPDIVREKVKMIRDAGIEVLGGFMMGFPGETEEDIKQTIAFALELPLTAASFSILTPFPGSEIYRELFENKKMTIAELMSLDYINYKNNLSEVPYEKLRKMQKSAYLRFHLRSRIIMRLICNITSFSKLKYTVRRAYVDAFE